MPYCGLVMPVGFPPGGTIFLIFRLLHVFSPLLSVLRNWGVDSIICFCPQNHFLHVRGVIIQHSFSISVYRTRYVKCLYVYNKVDMISIEDMDKLAREQNSIVVSVHMKLNLEALLVSLPVRWTRHLVCIGLPGVEGPMTYMKAGKGFWVDGSAAPDQPLPCVGFMFSWCTSSSYLPPSTKEFELLTSSQPMNCLDPPALFAAHWDIYCPLTNSGLHLRTVLGALWTAFFGKAWPFPAALLDILDPADSSWSTYHFV